MFSSHITLAFCPCHPYPHSYLDHIQMSVRSSFSSIASSLSLAEFSCYTPRYAELLSVALRRARAIFPAGRINILLAGVRGQGKSSLVKGFLQLLHPDAENARQHIVGAVPEIRPSHETITEGIRKYHLSQLSWGADESVGVRVIDTAGAGVGEREVVCLPAWLQIFRGMYCRAQNGDRPPYLASTMQADAVPQHHHRVQVDGYTFYDDINDSPDQEVGGAESTCA